MRAEKYCDEYMSVCLFVCLSHIAWPNFTEIFMRAAVAACARAGSVLLRRRCDTLCASGFVDDVTFAHNGPTVLHADFLLITQVTG